MQPDLTNKKVYVIDDVKQNGTVLSLALKKSNAEILEFTSCRKAIESLQEKKPDIILLDLLMPDISGFEFLQYIKQEPAYSNIPVIVITALVSEQDQKKAMQLGATRFIRKPVKFEDLYKNISEVLNL